MSFIYLAVYSDGSSYVGQTINSFEQLEIRYRGYSKKQRSLRPSEQATFALGMPALGVLEYCPPEKLDERERYWIKQHNQDGPNLNVSAGGSRVLARRQQAITDKLRRMESKLAKQARRKMR